MGDTLATTILARLQATRTVVIGGVNRQLPLNEEVSLTWPDGTGASEADEVFIDKSVSLTVAASPDDIDLNTLDQVDGDDDSVRTVDLAKVKGFWLENESSSGSLEVGGAAAQAWTGMLKAANDVLIIPAGGAALILMPAGVAVTNGVADTLRLTAVGATQTYTLLLLGDAS